METVVETFIQEDVQELIYDNEELEKWKSKISELGLEGQEKLAKHDKSPIPFTYMKKPMVEMFEVICPVKESLEEFDKEPIPMEALGAIGLAQREKHFHKIEIWYDDVEPDPVAIGYKDDSYNSDKYLICRWGSEKADFLKLREQAISRWVENQKTQLEERIADAKEKLNKIEILGKKKMAGDWVSI